MTRHSPTDVPPEEGGHQWKKGIGMAVCGFGCGAYDDRDDKSWIPPTTPVGMCPKNPKARKKFKPGWQMKSPFAGSHGGHERRSNSEGTECMHCHSFVRFILGTTLPEKQLPDGLCTDNPAFKAREKLGYGLLLKST